MSWLIGLPSLLRRDLAKTEPSWDGIIFQKRHLLSIPDVANTVGLHLALASASPNEDEPRTLQDRIERLRDIDTRCLPYSSFALEDIGPHPYVEHARGRRGELIDPYPILGLSIHSWLW